MVAALGEDPPRSCLIPQSVGHAIVKADCIRFKPHKDVGAKYLNDVLNSQPTRQRAKSIVHGVGRPRLNLGEIKAIVVPVPPTVEQQAIVAEVERRLSVIEKLDDLVGTSLKRSEHVRRSTLVRAFEGKLVQAIPSDEPANILLERLRVEKVKVSEALPIGLTEVAMVKRILVDKGKQPIIHVLKKAKGWLSTSDLLAKAGYPRDTAPDEMEAFYLELKKELQAVPRTIEIERRNDFDYFRAV